MQAYADRVVIRLGGEVVADHARVFGRDRTVYQPWHYVPVLARKPGALRNGAPFRDWEPSPMLATVRERLGKSNDADRQFVDILGAHEDTAWRQSRPPAPALPPACAAASGDSTSWPGSAPVAPGPVAIPPAAAPVPPADCARYDVCCSRRSIMERHDLLAMMSELQLAGMRAAYDEVMGDGIRRQHPPTHPRRPVQAEVAEKQARSIRYRLASAKLPLAKELADFDFSVSPVNAPLVRDLHAGGMLSPPRNAVLVGGTGSGKTHLAIAIAAHCIRNGARGRFFNVVDLVNQLEAEARAGISGKLAEQLTRLDLVVLDELGYLPFPRAAASCSST